MAANITLTANMETILGGAGLAGYIDIVLCGYGANPARVVGSGMLADAGIPKLKGPATSFSILLYGNDQIAPSNTFYAITIYDDKKQAIQTSNYILVGGPATVDLSTLTPSIIPPPPVPTNYITVNPAHGNVTVDDLGWNGPVVIDMFLTGNVVLTLQNFNRGQIVQFIIEQDAAGARDITWPIIVKNPPVIEPSAFGITTANFIVRADGNLYPQLGWS